MDENHRTKKACNTLLRTLYALGGPNYWHEPLDFPKRAKVIHDIISKKADQIVILYMFVIWGAHFTQHDLTEMQKTDRIIHSIYVPIIYLGWVVFPHKNKRKIRELLFSLVVELKQIYNDHDTEIHMLGQAKKYATLGFGILILSVIAYGVLGAVNKFKDGTFVTVIPFWPDVNDTSLIAEIVRVIMYIIYWIFITRILSGGFIIVLSSNICLSYQYRNLCCYFYSLNDIFEDNRLSQTEKEKKYEKGYIVGVKMHNITLRCTKLSQDIYHVGFACSLIFTVVQLAILMIQMMTSERNFVNVFVTVISAISVLTCTGCLWWKAGDITFEAAKLPSAMFYSGWHNCQRESARRIRPMLVISMSVSQNPVRMSCLKIVEISYSSFLTVVKGSYSFFSFIF